MSELKNRKSTDSWHNLLGASEVAGWSSTLAPKLSLFSIHPVSKLSSHCSWLVKSGQCDQLPFDPCHNIYFWHMMSHFLFKVIHLRHILYHISTYSLKFNLTIWSFANRKCLTVGNCKSITCKNFILCKKPFVSFSASCCLQKPCNYTICSQLVLSVAKTLFSAFCITCSQLMLSVAKASHIEQC